MGPGFRVCFYGLQKTCAKECFFEEQTFLLGLIGMISFAHCWGYSLLPAFISLRNAFGLNLSSLKPLLCSSLCSKAYDMARSSSRVLACVFLALACSTMLCFVGTTPSPAAGSTPLKQSLRAPAVQMEARGGGEGALGDMSPDTYIIGITVLCVASLFANISGFFNP